MAHSYNENGENYSPMPSPLNYCERHDQVYGGSCPACDILTKLYINDVLWMEMTMGEWYA